MDSDGQPLWPRSPASRLWLRRKLRARQGDAEQADPLDGLFDRQRAVLADPGRFKTLLCGRRAGKTELVIRDLAHGLLHDPPGSESLFCATTGESARRIFWRPLRRLAAELKLPLKFDESKWTVTGPTGNVLSVHGTETIRDLERQRGSKFRRVRIDECGAMRPGYLKQLVQDVLQATLMDDSASSMWLCGTPGVSAAGYWWEASADPDNKGWERHEWTAEENPTIEDYAGFIAEIMRLNSWNETSPQYLREYRNKWAADPSRIVFRYHPARNWLPELPQLAPGDRWVHCLISDFGVMDATASVVLCWPERFGRGVYAVHSWKESMLTTGEAAERIYGTWGVYKPQFLVGDVGGMGKAYQLEWNRRYPGIEMMAADKADKRAGLEFTSNALHIADSSGSIHQHRGLFVVGHQPELQRQLTVLQWDEEREDIQDGQEDDLAVCVVYGNKYSPAFLNATAEPAPPPVYAQTNTWALRPPPKQPAPLARAFSGAFRKKR